MERNLNSEQADLLWQVIKDKLLANRLLDEEEVKQTLLMYESDGLEHIQLITKYATILVCANRRPEQITKDIEIFLGHRSARFVNWLWDDHIVSHMEFYSHRLVSRATQYEAQSSNTTSRETQYEAQST